MYKSCEIIVTLARDGKWYALVVAGSTLGEIKRTEHTETRESARCDGEALADRILRERYSEKPT